MLTEITYRRSQARDYCLFVNNETNDQDGDLNFNVMDPQLDPDFWNEGWLGSPLPWINSPSLIYEHLTSNGNQFHTETVMFGRTNNEDDCRATPNVLLPSWMEIEGNSVLFNGQPVNGQVAQIQYTADPRFVQVYILGTPLLPGLRVRVTGVINLDEHDFSPLPWVFPGTPEIHPVYAIDVLQDFTQPRPSADLTGVWHANDVGTYYLRQVDGNVLWWLGLSRDQGQTFANVFHGFIQSRGGDGEPLATPIIVGDWVNWLQVFLTNLTS